VHHCNIMMREKMKIGIIGTGHVGATAAYTMAIQGIGSELVLVDNDRKRADAQRMDILHATPFSHPLHVLTGDYRDLAGCDVVILAAGVGQAPGETRMQLLARNAAVFAAIIPEVMRYVDNPILLVATNPLDVMTQIATTLSGLPSSRVLGSGTMLDTARFRALLAGRFDVSPSSVHAYVLGEHGDTEVLVWSGAQVAGVPLREFAVMSGQPLTAESMEDIDRGVRRAAYEIIGGKGATYYGIGAALARIVRSILHDERAVFTACTINRAVGDISDVALSMPVIIGRGGVERCIDPVLDDTEKRALYHSAQLIKNSVQGLGY